MTRLDGSTNTLDPGAVEALASGLRGRVRDPTAADYDAARTIWNAMIDRRPGLIVRCRGVADVIRAVRFARDHSLLVAVRGGGHNIGGSAVCDGGLMIDLSAMTSVRVDPESRRASVEPGATLGEVDRETQEFGLAVPTGINSSTGIAGLTLGGGFGWITRKFGLTIDNLLSADVVTADATLRRADANTHVDLFWALRGGGGNFGVVTGFEFQLHPRATGDLGHGRASARPCGRAAARVPRAAGHCPGRAHLLGSDAKGAAAAVLAAGVARARGADLCHVPRWGGGGGRTGHGRAARPGAADCRCRRSARLHGLAGGI